MNGYSKNRVRHGPPPETITQSSMDFGMFLPVFTAVGGAVSQGNGMSFRAVVLAFEMIAELVPLITMGRPSLLPSGAPPQAPNDSFRDPSSTF